jgi:hypothetical protein
MARDVRTYREQPKVPKGQWKSVYGGFEKTPFAGLVVGATVTPITRDMSPRARRARTRERLQLNRACEAYEREIGEALEQLAADETRATKEFHNGG